MTEDLESKNCYKVRCIDCLLVERLCSGAETSCFVDALRVRNGVVNDLQFVIV